MKYLIPLLAFLLIGCDGEKGDVTPSQGPLDEAASETKPTDAVSVENPNLKYVIESDVVTITSCAEDATGDLGSPTNSAGTAGTQIGSTDFGGAGRRRGGAWRSLVSTLPPRVTKERTSWPITQAAPSPLDIKQARVGWRSARHMSRAKITF